MRTTIILLLFVAFASTVNAQEPVFQWQKTGPFGGDITSVAGNNDFLLVGTGTARMLRSTNQGTTWNASSNGIGLKYIENAVRQIVITPQSQIAAVGFNYGEGSRLASTLYRSINQGQTWVPITFATIGYNTVPFLAASGELIIATVNFIDDAHFGPDISYRSINNGATWQRITTATLGTSRFHAWLHPWFSPSMLQVGQTFIAAQGSKGIARSLDKGETWTTATIGLPIDSSEIRLTNPYNIPTIHSLCKIDTTIFVAADTAVYISNDTGRTWSLTGFRMPTLKQSRYPSIINSLVNVGGTLIASVIPVYYREDDIPQQYTNDLSNRRLGLEGVLMRSDDKGKTWRSVPLTTLSYKVPQKLVAIGNDLYYLPVDVAAPLAVSINAGLWRSRNKGDTWEALNDSIPAFYTNTVHQTSDKRLFATTYGGRIFTKPNPEAKWERVLPTSMFVGFDEGAYNYLAVGNNLFATSFGRLFRSTDGALTWTEQKQGFLILRGYPSILRYFNGKMFACSADTIFQSSDTGRTWQLLKQFGKKDDYIRNLAFDPATNLIFAEFRSDVFSSSDNGITWNVNDAHYQKAKSTVLGNILVQASSEPYNTDYSFTRYSRDNGVTWQKTNLGLPSAVTIVDIKVFDNTIFTATSEGIYQAALTGTSVSHQSENAFVTAAPAPNPTTDHTELTFTLPRAALVGVTLYSTLGTEVWRSQSEILPAGEQHVLIDTRGLPTGVCVYRLTVGGVSSVGRVVVVR